MPRVRLPSGDPRPERMIHGIEITDLRKSYGDVLAVEIPRLQVEPGTTLVLAGPSGCGKSTLLRLLTGLVAPDRGRIAIEGTPMEAGTRTSLLRRIGYVIQEGGLFPHLTARGNVALAAEELGWSRGRIDARLEELLELTRLPAGLLGRYPSELSGGERQRVALMRALFLDPEVLLLDEPFAALDPMVREELQREVRTVISRLRKAVVFVTHDMAEAVYVADEIAVMRAGRIVERGAPRDLLRHPSDPFVATFIRAQRRLADGGDS